MTEPKQEQDVFTIGNEHLNDGRFEEALETYDALLAEAGDPASSPEVQNNRGLALFHLGRLDEATAAFRAALALMPDFAIAESNLGLALLNQKQFEEAITPLRKAVLLDPDLIETYYNLGLALYRTGRTEEAITAYEHFIANAPSTYTNYIEGVQKIIEQLKSIRHNQ